MQIERIAKAGPAAVILREKDLPEREYRKLAAAVMDICKDSGTVCILHRFWETAAAMGAKAVHLPLPVLRSMTAEDREQFAEIGASCHSREEAEEAAALGCTYIAVGHIFATDCKKGVPTRGVEFLRDICNRSSIPVYAIGGVSSDNVRDVRWAGAAGVCVMSGLMCCENPKQYIKQLKIGGNADEV